MCWLKGNESSLATKAFEQSALDESTSTFDEDAIEQGAVDTPTVPKASDESYEWYAYLLYGAAILMPYNAMLNSVDYFGDKFGKDFQFLNAICLTTPNFITLFITAFIWKPDNRLGAFWGYAGLCAICLLVPFLESRSIVLVAAVVLGVFNSLAQAAMNGLGSRSPQLLQALQTGVGLSGVLASGIRIVTKVSLGLESGTQLFFAMGASMSLAALMLLSLNPDRQLSITGPAPAARCGLLKKIPVLLAAFFLNFGITLTFFPGLVATIAAQDVGRMLSNGWWPVLLFATFNAFDFLGKYFANWSVAQFRADTGATKLLLLQIVRAGLVYVMAYMATTDVVVWLLVATLAFTNGWFGSAGFGVQHKVLEPEMLDQAAVISTFFILFGITSGSFLGQAIFD